MTDAELTMIDMSAKSEEAAELMRALSNGPRLLVLCHLMAAGELQAGELVRRVGLSQSAVSQHLAKLREQGLIAFRRDAQALHYRIADPRVGRILGLLHEMFCPDLSAN